MIPARIVTFDPAASAPVESYLAPEKLLAGNPKHTLWPQYSDASGQFFTGIWHSEVGKWRVAYTEEEYCQLLEGVSILTGEDGHATTLRAGDSFVIPRHFKGSWEVVEPTRKIYVIYEAQP